MGESFLVISSILLGLRKLQFYYYSIFVQYVQRSSSGTTPAESKERFTQDLVRILELHTKCCNARAILCCSVHFTFFTGCGMPPSFSRTLLISPDFPLTSA